MVYMIGSGMRQIFLVVFLCFMMINVAQAQGHLSAVQIERVRAFKQLIIDVDKKTLAKTISEIEKAADPQFALQIQETMAKVYANIVIEKNVQDQDQREWLYGMVALNMANLQFGGRARDPLSRMIVQKLRENLPATVLTHVDFHVSVE